MRMLQAEVIAAEFVGASDMSSLDGMDGQTGFRFSVDPDTGMTLVHEWLPRIVNGQPVDTETSEEASEWIAGIAQINNRVPGAMCLDVADAIGRQIRSRRFLEGIRADG